MPPAPLASGHFLLAARGLGLGPGLGGGLCAPELQGLPTRGTSRKFAPFSGDTAGSSGWYDLDIDPWPCWFLLTCDEQGMWELGPPPAGANFLTPNFFWLGGFSSTKIERSETSWYQLIPSSNYWRT